MFTIILLTLLLQTQPQVVGRSDFGLIGNPVRADNENRFISDPVLYAKMKDEAGRLAEKYKNNRNDVRRKWVRNHLVDYMYLLEGFHGPLTQTEHYFVDVVVNNVCKPFDGVATQPGSGAQPQWYTNVYVVDKNGQGWYVSLYAIPNPQYPTTLSYKIEEQTPAVQAILEGVSPSPTIPPLIITVPSGQPQSFYRPIQQNFPILSNRIPWFQQGLVYPNCRT